MLTLEEIKNISQEYLELNNASQSYVFQVLEEFKEKESFLKTYQETLNYLEKAKNKINLSLFESIIEKIYEELSKFDPDDLKSNILKIEEIVNALLENSQDIEEITKELEKIKNLWKGFINRYKTIEKTKINNFINVQFNMIFNEISNVNISNIGNLQELIRQFKGSLKQLILLYEQLYEYKQYHFFIGNEAEEYYFKIVKFFKEIDNERYNEINGKKINQSDEKNSEKSSESESESYQKIKDSNKYIEEFIDKLKQINKEIEEFKNHNSYLGTIKIPIVKAIHKSNSNIFKYTLKFGDFIIKYEPFLKNDDVLDFKETGKFIYIDNYPIKGIFNAEKTITKLKVSKNYLKANFDLNNSIVTSFFSILSANSILGLFSIFNTSTFIPFMISVFISIPTLFFLKKTLYKKTSIKYNVKNFFPFIKNNFIIFSIGDDVDVNHLLLESVKEIDNTILNKSFIRKIDKYIVNIY